MAGLLRRAFGRTDPGAFARGAERMNALNTMQRENEVRLGLQQFQADQRDETLNAPAAPNFNPDAYGSEQRIIEPPPAPAGPEQLSRSPDQYVPEQGPNVITDDETGTTTIKPAPTSLGTQRLTNPDLVTQQSSHLTVPDYNPALGNAEGVDVNDVTMRVMKIRERVATGNYDNGNGLAGSPFGQFLGWFTDDDAEAARRDNASEAIDWLNSEEGRKYFLQNPDALRQAEIDPVGFYLTYKGEAGLRQERRTLEQSTDRSNRLITNVANGMESFLSSQGSAVLINEARRLGVDPAAAVAIYGIESNFGAATGESDRGATGGMQVIDETFNSMKAWFTDPANIEQYGLSQELVTTARAMQRGDQVSELQAGLLYIKYNELIGNPKNLWGAGYQGSADSVNRLQRPLNADDGNITNYDYNRAYVELYNQASALMGMGGAPITQGTSQAGLNTTGANTSGSSPVYTAQSGNTGNVGVATENVSSLQTVEGSGTGNVQAGPNPIIQGPVTPNAIDTPSTYINDPSRAGYDMRIANENRTRLVSGLERINQRIRDTQRMAEIYRASGDMAGYNQLLQTVQTLRTQGQQIEASIIQANQGIIQLQGMQGINDITYGNNTNRLSMVWSEYSGRDVRIVPRSDGKFDLMMDGQMVTEGMTRDQVVQAAQLQFDSAYRQRISDRNDMIFEQYVQTQAAMEEQLAETLSQITLENVKSQAAIILEQVKQQATNFTSTGNGEGVVIMNGVPYHFNPMTPQYKPGETEPSGTAPGLTPLRPADALSMIQGAGGTAQAGPNPFAAGANFQAIMNQRQGGQ